MKALGKMLLVLLMSLLIGGCTSLFFYPEKRHYNNPLAAILSPEDVYFKTADGLTLHGWFFHARRPKASMLVLHGNAENLTTHVNSVLWLVPQGFNVFIIDYRGYGKSEGKPSADGVHRDAAAALETLRAMPGVDRGRIVVLGQSIGGAVAVYTVANDPEKDAIRALVVDSAFSSYRRIAREKMAGICCTWPFQYPGSLLFSDTYSPEKWIPRVSPVPVLIMHGKWDPVVPVHHAMRLYDAARKPKEFWETGLPGHINSLDGEQVRRRFVAYLEERLGGPQTGKKRP